MPVVRDADRLSLAGIEAAINDYGTRARDGKLKLEELQGGTFSITNGGVFGSLMSTPIPQFAAVGYSGMHKIQPRPVAIDNKVEIRPMMYLALSYDHRVVDGREAVTFPGAREGKPGRPAASVAGHLIASSRRGPQNLG
ncbi:MAG: 2-oxo acid dehydrogenase subunit E2 [Rhizomicrobium sp.]